MKPCLPSLSCLLAVTALALLSHGGRGANRCRAAIQQQDAPGEDTTPGSQTGSPPIAALPLKNAGPRSMPMPNTSRSDRRTRPPAKKQRRR